MRAVAAIVLSVLCSFSLGVWVGGVLEAAKERNRRRALRKEDL